MRSIKLFLRLFLVIAISYTGFCYAAESDQKDKQFPEFPEWLDRIDMGLDAGTDIDPRIYFETVQPLYQGIDKEHTLFIQPRYSLENSNNVYNLGLGYRQLLQEDSILLGGNTFFDYEDHHEHYRIGFGGEAFINQIEFRTNTYIGLSPRRLIKESSTGLEYEKAVDGIDGEAGLPIPYLNWIKVYGAGYLYNYEKFKNKKGWKVRSEIKPFGCTTINLIVWDDNKGDTEFRVDARVSIPLGSYDKKDMASNIGFSKEPYPEKMDHSNRTLDRVEREYRIEAEHWIETVGATVEVKRGN